MLPHQVGLEITYDGRIQTSVSHDMAGSGGDSDVYTVVAGDTLWAIAKRYYGSGMKYTVIYDANTETIEEAAKAHGMASSSSSHWIWPGTTLIIPGLSASSTDTTMTMRGASNPELGNKIAKAATAFTYTDVASGQSDSMSITFHDTNKEWIGSNKPPKGAVLGAKLKLTNWNQGEGEESFDCGTFVLDDFGFSGRPLSCVLGGVSVPVMEDFKSLPHTQTWEKTTIQDIATEIAGRAGVSVYYDADSIQIEEIEQNNKTDSAFLYSLCEKYGLAMKVYNHKIVIFDIVRYEEKDSVLTIKENEMLSWSYKETVEGTYTAVELSYTDPDTEDTISVTMGNSGRKYAINTQASSRYDAELQAAAKVNAANRAIDTMTVVIRANPKVVASQCVTIEDLASVDGKYYIDKIKHSIGNGYTMQLTLHRVQTPVKVTASVLSGAGGGAYTVASGDTLWEISRKFYGTGTKYNVIYEANRDIIEATAKEHGMSDSENGHWIWPGEVLTIPEV